MLASCGGPPDGVAPGEAVEQSGGETGTPAGAPVERIACAVGSAPLTEDCTVERAADGDVTVLTMRHPDGGFRRLRMGADGAFTAADGAVPATVTTGDGVAEVRLGDARYRLPLGRP